MPQPVEVEPSKKTVLLIAYVRPFALELSRPVRLDAVHVADDPAVLAGVRGAGGRAARSRLGADRAVVEVLQRRGEPAAAVREHGDQQVDREPDDPEPAAAHREAAPGQGHAAGAAAILDLRGVEPCSFAKAHLGVLPRCAPLLNVEDGADGARTRDLLAASQTLSQLSYGPLSAREL